jgi:NAD(P)-dependent dehydrogenase (short-subunit alcohol dehydrogenase family)
MSFDGLTVLVTGATGGIGELAVAQLAQAGATVLVHGRSLERVERVVAAVRAAGGTALALVADLASLADARALVTQALGITAHVDVLVNNAGVGFGSDRARRELSRDGLELRFAVNYLAPVAITGELLAQSSKTLAVVNVASAGQLPIVLDDLQSERRYDGVEAYRRSKLALVMYTFDLAAETAVAANALHPGTFLDTAMVRDAGIAPLGRASDGAAVIVEIVRRSLVGTTGEYFNELVAARADPQAYDLAVRAALRERTQELLRL